MSCVMPPGMALRARSASAADRGWLARYCSWMVMRPMITLRSRPGDDAEQLDERGVRIERQAVDRSLRPPRDAVAGAGFDAGGDQTTLVVRRVQERPRRE